MFLIDFVVRTAKSENLRKAVRLETRFVEYKKELFLIILTGLIKYAINSLGQQTDVV